MCIDADFLEDLFFAAGLLPFFHSLLSQQVNVRLQLHISPNVYDTTCQLRRENVGNRREKTVEVVGCTHVSIVAQIFIMLASTCYAFSNADVFEPLA